MIFHPKAQNARRGQPQRRELDHGFHRFHGLDRREAGESHPPSPRRRRENSREEAQKAQRGEPHAKELDHGFSFQSKFAPSAPTTQSFFCEIWKPFKATKWIASF
jgi:hypothetical protein